MKRILFIMLVLVLAIGLMPALAFADPYDSPGTVIRLGENTLNWTGQGVNATTGELETVECDASNTGYLLWIFTFDGATLDGPPTLTVNGVEQPAGTPDGNTYHFVTEFFALDTLTAYVTFNVASLPKSGHAEMNLTISHGCPGEPLVPQATLTVLKFYDANANGVQDAGELLLDDWYFTIGEDFYSTPFSDIVDPGTYTIAELMPNEVSWHSSTPTSVEVTLEDGDDVTIEFGNYCLVGSGGLTLGFWSNKNGQKLVGADDLALLAALNLVNGGPFNPTAYSQFRTWLLSATATNMAYMLSAQLAAMELNVYNGGVDGGAFYIPYGGTIDALMAEANAELGLHPTAYSGDTWRGYQEFLKNCLDALNNGALVIPSAPCPYTFTLPVA